MSFLGGLFILALPLIGVPVVIHMMKKRQRDVIPWGAMQFLRDPTRRGQRMSDMDRWLLLAARMLVLALLIGALSQPILRWGQSSGSSLPTQLVMLDDTRSTFAADQFDLIRESADELVTSFPKQTPIEVWAAGNPARRIAINQFAADRSSNGGTGSDNVAPMTRSQLRSAIAKWTPRGCDGKFDAAVRQAIATSTFRPKETVATSDAFRNSTDSSLDVWLFTDSTAAGWSEGLTPSAIVPGKNHRLHLMQVDSNAGAGYQLAVSSVESSLRAIAENETVGLSATVTNHGSVATPSGKGIWKQNGQAFAETDLNSLDPGESRIARTELTIKKSGTHAITFQWSPESKSSTDLMVVDDEGHVVVQVIGEMPLLVIANDQDEIGVDSNIVAPTDADYLAAALGRNLGGWKSGDTDSNQESDASWQSLFRPEVRTASELDEIQWQQYPVVAWLGGEELPPHVMKKLVRRVRQGTGLWITLGSRTNRVSINEALGSHGLGIGIASDEFGKNPSNDRGLVGPLVINRSAEDMQRLHPPDPTDPILAALADTERLDLDAVRIRRRVTLRPPRNQSSSRMMLRTFEGDPIALLSSVGRGRVVVQALPMNPSWSNFPLSKSFVVWVLQVLDHLSEPISENFNLMAGQMFRHRVESIDHEFQLTTPDGSTQELIALPQTGVGLSKSSNTNAKSHLQAGVIRFDRTEGPGIYRLKNLDVPDATETVFTVNGDPSESAVLRKSDSKLALLAADQRIGLHLHSKGFDFAGLLSQIPKDELPGTKGHPLWPALLFGLLIAIALETFLAGYAALRRYGQLGTTSPADASFAVGTQSAKSNESTKQVEVPA